MTSYAEILRQASALMSEENTRGRILSLRNKIQVMMTAKHVTRFGKVRPIYAGHHIKVVRRKLRRLEEAYALRSLIGWGAAPGIDLGVTTGDHPTFVTFARS